jgi:hypothetical protein
MNLMFLKQHDIMLAEKLPGRGKKCQGMTLVVPQMPQHEDGL